VGGRDRRPPQPLGHVPAAAAARLAAQKKRLVASERDEAARAAWRREAAGLDPAALVFVDETGSHTALTRLRARAPRGERAVGAVPRNPGPNLTLLAALTPGGIGPALAVDGAVDGALFAAYVERCLLPALRPGQTVVLDNLSVHKDARARAAIEGAGCRVRFLPAYSPDLNPIEPAFAKVKARLRRAAARTRDDLLAAAGAALDAVTPEDARGFFAHCGYPLPDQH
jgi:transposase